MRITLFSFCVVVCLFPAWASEPGQPMDCDDITLEEPGHSCSLWYSCVLEDPDGLYECQGIPGDGIVDNESRVFAGRKISLGPCATGQSDHGRWEIVWTQDGNNWQVFAHAEDRCIPFATDDRGGIGLSFFDEERGILVLRTNYINCELPGPVGSECDWSNKTVTRRAFAIDGFTTTFEILQSYTPTSGPIAFRVPFMPEGFDAADYFDTYYGTLDTLGDWSQAQPLQCGYPTTSPSVGDYLTVADTLPNPSPGQGYYYVTAVNYLGEQRYGRKAIGGQLSGRDPAVLPECAK